MSYFYLIEYKRFLSFVLILQSEDSTKGHPVNLELDNIGKLAPLPIFSSATPNPFSIAFANGVLL